MNEKCYECPPIAEYAWILCGLFAALVCWLIYEYSGGEADLSTFTISITHFQVTYIYFSFKLKYPTLTINIVDWIFGIVSLSFTDLASPECAAGGSISNTAKWYLNLFAPFMILLPFVVKYFALDRRGLGDQQKTICALLNIMTITYIFTISTALTAW